MILQQDGPVVNRLLAGALFDFVTQRGVRLDDINELLRKIILGSLIVILEHRGAHLGRWNWKNRAHQPIWATPETTEAHKIHVLITDTTEETIDVFRLQEMADILLFIGPLGRSQLLPFRYNAADVLFTILIGLTRTTAILDLLTTTTYLLTGREHALPTGLTLSSPDVASGLLLNQKLTAFNADTAENLGDHLEELDVVDWARETIMSEMTGTSVVIIAA